MGQGARSPLRESLAGRVALVTGRARNTTPADVPSEADVAHMVEVSTERFGLPTVLVNNAGVNAFFACDESSYVIGASLLVDFGVTARRAG